MEFEWDEKKRLSNLKKHGLDFDFVEFVFDDINHITYESIGSYTEKRFTTIGLFIDEIVTVVIHTGRNSIIRIISFRHASKKEKRFYYENYQNDE
jgi:uncharacterized DUF497 family protein